jgi:ribosomal protein L44E
MWDQIEQIRNEIAGYEPEVVGIQALSQREKSKLAMRKLYARRRKAGLNAHGKPFSVKQRTNKRWKLKL